MSQPDRPSTADPIRKSQLPSIPPPEWEFSTVIDTVAGCVLLPSDAGAVVVRRLVSYGDWEPVHPDRWADEEPETDEQRADRLETERDHVKGDHRHCGLPCEVEFPGDMLRNGILARAIPGSAAMLDELLRRAATQPPPADAGLRDRIAGAIYERHCEGYVWADAHPDDRQAYGDDADAVLAVLPAPADRAHRRACPSREPLLDVQCVKEAGHETHTDRPGRIWYPAPADRAAVLREAAEYVGNEDTCGCGGCDTCIPNALAAGLRDKADQAEQESPAYVRLKAAAHKATEAAHLHAMRGMRRTFRLALRYGDQAVPAAEVLAALGLDENANTVEPPDEAQPAPAVDLPARLEAALTERYTALGNPFSAMRYAEKGPDGWPADHPIGPHRVAEVLRELMADEAQQAAPVEQEARRVRAVLETEAVVGRSALEYRGMITSALMADEAQPAQDLAAADNPTPLRWGLNDVLWGDDDSVTVLLSGPAGEPYWLELDPEGATVLRQDLAGPDGAEQQAEVPVVPPIAYSGKGRAFCVTCPRPAGEDVPLTAYDIEPYECCAACGRDLRDVAEGAQR